MVALKSGQPLLEWLDVVIQAGDEVKQAGKEKYAAEKQAELEDLANGLVVLLETHRPLSSKGKQTADENLSQAAKQEQIAEVKSKRNWHVKLSDIITRESEETYMLRLAANLSAISLRQCSLDQIEENIGVHMESASRLLNKISTDAGIALFGGYIAEVVLAKANQPSSTAAMNSDSNTVLSRLVLAFAKSFRAILERPVLPTMPVVECCTGALESILAVSPIIVRNSVGQIEGIVASMVCHTKLHQCAARILASTPAAYGGASAVAWDAMVNALLFASHQLLFGQIYRKTQAVGTPNVSSVDYFVALSKIGSSRANTSMQQMSVIKPTVVFCGLLACLARAIEYGQPKVFLELRLAPWIDLIEGALSSNATRLESTFSLVAVSILELFVKLLPIARLHMLRFRTRVRRCLERVLALPTDQFPSSCQLSVFSACKTWCLTFSGTPCVELAEACIKRATELLGAALGQKSKEKQEKKSILAKGLKGRASKKRRVANLLMSTAERIAAQAIQYELLICIGALEMCEVILQTCGAQVNPVLRNEFDSVLLHALKPVIMGQAIVLDRSSPVGISAELRLALCKTLLATVMAPMRALNTSRALPSALTIFQACRYDVDSRIVEVSARAASACAALVHPTAPVIGAPKSLIYSVHEEETSAPRKRAKITQNAKSAKKAKTKVSKKQTIKENEDDFDKQSDLGEDDDEESEGEESTQKVSLVDAADAAVKRASKPATEAMEVEESTMSTNTDHATGDNEEESEEPVEKDEELTSNTPLRRSTRATKSRANSENEEEKEEEEEEEEEAPLSPGKSRITRSQATVDESEENSGSDSDDLPDIVD
eukprot:CAMPEP_0184511390 /NCGR_PEP_ID=MMETSP0198_2-20121128/2325_1 /TAXON_ID=1112570 /ORGANISM="Thraustochytrium sp., Strain LLF1b" /LENGTH=834 /DNA_ID=CAMNT_0026901351 /DNA_START=134 /DNA_END=2639 /DNA_ORIENTATION=+